MFKLPCNCTHLNGEGNGSPLQYACLENPRDGGDWWAAVYGVTQSRTRLKWLSSSSSNHYLPVCLPVRVSGGDGIPVELFQILKDDAVKVLHSISQKIWKTQQWPQDWKRSVFTPIPKKGNAKECSNYCTIALISHTSKVMLKILQARFQQYVNHEPPDGQARFRKGRGIRDKLPTSTGSSKKQESSRKTYISMSLTMTKPLTVRITTNCGKLFKRWEYQTTLPASGEICMQVKKQQLELTMNNRLVPNWERSISRLCIATLLI